MYTNFQELEIYATNQLVWDFIKFFQRNIVNIISGILNFIFSPTFSLFNIVVIYH
jgi:hypothetical protein